jgi:hypothetical protein
MVANSAPRVVESSAKEEDEGFVASSGAKETRLALEGGLLVMWLGKAMSEYLMRAGFRILFVRSPLGRRIRRLTGDGVAKSLNDLTESVNSAVGKLDCGLDGVEGRCCVGDVVSRMGMSSSMLGCFKTEGVEPCALAGDESWSRTLGGACEMWF